MSDLDLQEFKLKMFDEFYDEILTELLDEGLEEEVARPYAEWKARKQVDNLLEER